MVPSSRVDADYSEDGGETFTGRRTIFSDSSNSIIRTGAFTLMGKGRFGGLVTTGDDRYKHWFVKSDDGGAV